MNEYRPILSAAKYRPMIIVSRNVRYVGIRGVTRGASSFMPTFVRYFEHENMFITYL